MRAWREREIDRCKQHNRCKRQRDPDDRYPSLAPGPRQFGQHDCCQDDCNHRESELRRQENECARRRQIRAEAEGQENDGRGYESANGNCRADDPQYVFPINRLDIGPEHRDQVIRLHCCRSRAIAAASARKPRCTLTFTFDSDKPQRAAVSATLNPSNLTHSITRPGFFGRWPLSLARSRWLSVLSCSPSPV